MSGHCMSQQLFRFVRGHIRQPLVVLLAWVLAGLFLWAGLPKLWDLEATLCSVEAYQIVPRLLLPFSARALPWVEVFSALALLWPPSRRAGAAVLGSCLLVFIAAISLTMIRGLDIDCGCFPGVERSVGLVVLIEDLVLLTYCILILIGDRRRAPAATAMHKGV